MRIHLTVLYLAFSTILFSQAIPLPIHEHNAPNHLVAARRVAPAKPPTKGTHTSTHLGGGGISRGGGVTTRSATITTSKGRTTSTSSSHALPSSSSHVLSSSSSHVLPSSSSHVLPSSSSHVLSSSSSHAFPSSSSHVLSSSSSHAFPSSSSHVLSSSSSHTLPPSSSHALSSSSSHALSSSSSHTLASSSSHALASSSSHALASSASHALASSSSLGSSTTSRPSHNASLPVSPTTSSPASATATASSNASSSCPLYTGADAVDLSSRDLLELEKRAGEEYWFRWEKPPVGTDFLQLEPRKDNKNFDDQAYKWISMDVSKVTRSRLQGRVPVLYVLPAGTRAATLAAAQDFAVTSKAQKPADFVTKQNEPGDVGINGVISATPNAPIPLNTFRSKVLRVVVKIDNNPKAKGKATFQTIANGKISKTANKADQSAFNAVC